jgi:arsenate reductase
MGDAFVDVYSAGVRPTGQVSEEAIEVMRERGVDIKGQRSKGLDEVPVAEMDYVVSLTAQAASEVCPPAFEGVTLDWDIEDPVGGPIDEFRATRDVIEEKVRDLIQRVWRDDRSSTDN